MSKIGKKSIIVPEAATITIGNGIVTVKGPKGNLEIPLHRKVKVELINKELRVSVPNPEDRRQKALWGTFRSLLASAVIGVTEGFEKKLELVGVGYKASAAVDKLVLNLGFSHPVELAIPKGMEVKVEKNIITIRGWSKQEVGEFAAHVRSQRKPEPYKGKGIKYSDEVIRRKAGKVVKAVGAG